ncbi:hypothetical protein [Superficieibacter sp. HKU1]|uniref:hypothetical protein n=1 Tax=Superficieibacter sp. HKU1 TaxID=3031919 RepID=UPI0023E2B0BD|nr:hypothetical protein [Superficieibacter sp. HKU1]WES70104.1 hypothetical protein P0H77_09060 [Superficieibacter sp. HKU1]
MGFNTNSIDSIIDRFADEYPVELLLVLLQIVALPEQGGRGYHIEMNNPYIDMDGWEVDHESKTIYIDQTGLMTNYDVSDYAELLKEAIETEFFRNKDEYSSPDTMGKRESYTGSSGRSCWCYRHPYT